MFSLPTFLWRESTKVYVIPNPQDAAELVRRIIEAQQLLGLEVFAFSFNNVRKELVEEGFRRHVKLHDHTIDGAQLPAEISSRYKRDEKTIEHALKILAIQYTVKPFE